MRMISLPLAVVFAYVALFPRSAHAYLDPSTGSMLLSAVISVLVTTGLAIQSYGYKLLGWVRRITRRGRSQEPTP